MANTKKTLQELEMSGSLKHDPQRYKDRKDTSPAKPLGNAPKYFDKGHKKLWKEVVSNCHPNVIGSTDTYIVELTVLLLYRMRAGTLVKASEIGQLSSALSQLGLTPQSRLRMNISAEKPTVERKDDEITDWTIFKVQPDGEGLLN